MTLRRFFASLIALAVIAAAPGLVSASAALGGDCVAASCAALDDGCGGGVDMSSCALPCALGHAAVGRTADDLMALLDSAPLKDRSAGALSVNSPPDTAPPKSLSA